MTAAGTIAAASPDAGTVVLASINWSGHLTTAVWAEGRQDWPTRSWAYEATERFAAGCGVVATSRTPGVVDLAAVDRGGRLLTTWWTPAGWARAGADHVWRNLDELDLRRGARAGYVRQRPAITGLTGGDLLVVAVRADGRVRAHHWSAAVGWRTSTTEVPDLDPAIGLTVVPDRDRARVFGVARGGLLRVAGWDREQGWGGWRLVDDQPPFRPGAGPVAAVSHQPGRVDLAVVDAAGHLQHARWFDAPGRPRPRWFDLGDRFVPGARPTWLSRRPDVLDLFAVDAGGRVRTRWWLGTDLEPAAGWIDLGGSFRVGTEVAAVSRRPDVIDLAAGGEVALNRWFVDGGSWQPAQWRPIGHHYIWDGPHPR